jgi:hypothetical protein
MDARSWTLRDLVPATPLTSRLSFFLFRTRFIPCPCSGTLPALFAAKLRVRPECRSGLFHNLHHLLPLELFQPPNRRLAPTECLKSRRTVFAHNDVGLEAAPSNVIRVEMQLAPPEPQVLEKVGNTQLVLLGIFNNG